MIKDIIREKFSNCSPTEYLYKLTVCRNELNDMIAEFNKHWNWCPKCGTYMHDDETVIEFVRDFSPARNARRCNKCKSILKLLDN